jgi:hypothetical protein
VWLAPPDDTARRVGLILLVERRCSADRRPTLDQRMEAATWLADRGWGRAKEIVELTGEASPAQRLELLRRLSDSEREQLRLLLQRALEGEQENQNAGAIAATANTAQPQTDTPPEQPSSQSPAPA